jgi:four helix bundle protein
MSTEPQDDNRRRRLQAAAETSAPNPFDSPYDIYARTFQFAVRVIRFVRTFPGAVEARAVGDQLIRAGTSVGSNMEEADAAESRRDFIHKAGIARKEARESRYWARICVATEIGDRREAESLIAESEQLIRILSSIIRRSRSSTTE